MFKTLRKLQIILGEPCGVYLKFVKKKLIIPKVSLHTAFFRLQVTTTTFKQLTILYLMVTLAWKPIQILKYKLWFYNGMSGHRLDKGTWEINMA